MKRNMLVLAAAAALLAIMAGLIGLFAFALPSQYGETFLGVFPEKMERLQSASGKRLILVGGSSVPFALKSGLVEETFPEYTVVDFGLYAQMGTTVMLDFLEEQLREGDIVILSPEQDSQALSTRFDGELLWQACDGNFALLGGLEPERWEYLAVSLPVFAGKKCMYALTAPPKPQDIYARGSFDAYGDIASPLRSCNIMAGGFDPNQKISFEESVIDPEFIDVLNAFAAKAKEKGAVVYYRFGPMNRAALAGEESRADAYYEFLRGKLDFPVLGDPHRSIMDSGWFYDTNFHLNDSGAVVFTKYLVEDLKLLWKDTSPTRIPLPAMPEPGFAGEIQGDDSCAALFTYRLDGDGWIITGLTAEGNQREELVIPTHYDGKAVTGLEETALHNSRNLRKLTVQANIGVLYDGMFAGCLLEELILTAPGPGSYSVGRGLMEGGEFFIRVPAAVADAYRRHYSWQMYSAYIMILE